MIVWMWIFGSSVLVFVAYMITFWFVYSKQRSELLRDPNVLARSTAPVPPTIPVTGAGSTVLEEPPALKRTAMFLDIVWDKQLGQITHIWRTDPLFVMSFWLLIAGAVALTVQFIIPWFMDWPIVHGWKMLLADSLALLGGLFLIATAFTRVTPADLFVRQLFGSYRAFMDTIAWDLFAYGVRIPGSQRISFTPKSGKEMFVSQCKVKQAEDEGLIGKTLEFRFVFQIQWRLDVLGSPWTVIENWIDDFTGKTTDDAMAAIEKQVIALVISRSDEFCQEHFVENFLEERTAMNRKFLQKIAEPLLRRGVLVTAAVIDHVEDKEGHNYIVLRAEATEATARRRMQEQVAAQDKEGRIKIAEENLKAWVVEQDARKKALEAELMALKAKEAVDKQAATNQLQPEVVLLETVGEKGTQNIANARLLKLTPTDVDSIAKMFPTYLRSPAFVLGEKAITALGILQGRDDEFEKNGSGQPAAANNN